MKLNYVHILTLIFVVAKLFDKIDWSWWLVLAPSIAYIGFGLVIVISTLVAVVIAAIKS